MKRVFLLLALVLAVILPGEARADAPATDLLVEVIMPSGAEYVVIDVMDGVEARYRTMAYNDVYGAYSCAGYPKAYYAALYGVNVQNLTDLGPPHPEDLFKQVAVPQKGDLIFYPSPPSRNNHSAIVKSFDGERITLIEQDYKWAQAGGTYTYINRTIPYPPDSSHVYQIWRLVFVPEESSLVQDDLPVSDPPESTPPDETGDDPEPPEAEPPQDPEETVPVFAPEGPADGWVSVVTIGRSAITVNGTDMPIDAPAFIENDRTIMPVRWIGYALGLSEDDIHWDEPSRTVTVANGEDIIVFTIDSNLLFINYIPTVMDCPASLRLDRAYLPVKYLAEAMGVSFEWDEASSSVTFYK